MQAGYSKSGDFHAAVGYKYNLAAIEAGFIGSPLNNDQPFYITSILMFDLPLSESLSITPVAGIAYKYFTAEKVYQQPYKAIAGVRLNYKCFLIQ